MLGSLRFILALGRGAARVAAAPVSVAVLVSTVLVTAAIPAITVEQGDVLRIEVLGAEEFSREAPVDANGAIALPHVGAIAVAGRDTAAIAAEIATALETAGLLRTPVVLVEFAAYRPVYLGGAVQTPGAVAYVPGLTVRKAVIAAGGLRRNASGLGAGEDALAAMVKRRSVALALAQAEARILRLEAELADLETLPDAAVGASALAARDGEAILAAEAGLLSDRRAAVQASDAHTAQMLTLVASELDTLARQAALQEEESGLQNEEIDGARILVEKGLMPRSRLQELLRERSSLRRDQLATDAFAARARQVSETLRFEATRSRLRQREDMRIALQEALRTRASLDAELEALDLKVMSFGLSATTLREATAPRFVIHRTAQGAARRLDVGPDAAILPGDVLEVTLAQGTDVDPTEPTD